MYSTLGKAMNRKRKEPKIIVQHFMQNGYISLCGVLENKAIYIVYGGL